MATADKARDASDKPVTAPSISHADLYEGPGSRPRANSSGVNKAATDAHVQAGTLPELKIEDHQNKHWWSGTLAVATDLAKGAYNEVTEHPVHLLESAAIGAAVGVGTALVAPEVAVAAAVAGVGYAGYKVYENGGKWLNATGTVANESGHTDAEIAAAHLTVQGLGAGATDIAAGVAGGVVGNIAGRSLALSLRGAAVAAPEATTTAPTAQATLQTRPEVAATHATPTGIVRLEVANPVPPNPTQAAATARPEVAATLPPAPTAAATPEVATPAPPKPPSIYSQPTIYERPAQVPFTQGETSIQLADPKAWNEFVDNNGTNAYGSLVMRFANKWATNMERRMAAGEPMSKTMIMGAADDSDPGNVSGAMAMQVENLLSKTWKYGLNLSKFRTHQELLLDRN